MKGFRPLLCATLSSVVLLSACGGSSGTSDNTITPDVEVMPGAISSSGDTELLADAAKTLRVSEGLPSLVFFGDALESGGQVICLNGDRVTQVFSGLSDTGGIPTQGDVSLEFTDCQISESLTLNNSANYTWDNYQYFEPGVLFPNSTAATLLDPSESVFNSLEIKRLSGTLTVSGPLRVSYSSSENEVVRTSDSSAEGPFNLSFGEDSWSVADYLLTQTVRADGSTETELNGTFTDLSSPTNEKLMVSTVRDLKLMPGEAFPNEGEMVFRTLENSMRLVVDSQESVTVAVDNGDDGSVDSQSTYSWEQLLAF